MKKYILYAHDGSGNHGCEALVRTTAELLGGKSRVSLLSARPEQDIKYGLDALCRIVLPKEGRRVPRWGAAFLRAYFDVRVKKKYDRMDYLAKICDAETQSGDIALSIGGDTYCYDFTERLAMHHKMWKLSGAKTVYWGCSIEPELLKNPKIAADVRRYDLITARESVSYEALKEVNPNTLLVADSAFMLNRETVLLPKTDNNAGFVGINSSPLIEQNEKIPGIARENFCKLIEKILADTNMDILLIPHVVWEAVDDRSVLRDLYEKYAKTGRVYMVEDGNCERLKGYISQCRFFVGARTHATIAAYSSCVPTLVVGYSVKARGIAIDLFGTEEDYVIPVQQLQQSEDLVKRFEWMLAHENEMRDKLSEMIPIMQQRVLAGAEAVRKL